MEEVPKSDLSTLAKEAWLDMEACTLPDMHDRHDRTPVARQLPAK